MTGRARLANDAWESLLTVHATFMKSFAAEPIWGDVSLKEYDVLYALAKADAPVRLTDLHRRVLLSQPALSRMVDRLVERGLVVREKQTLLGSKAQKSFSPQRLSEQADGPVLQFATEIDEHVAA